MAIQIARVDGNTDTILEDGQIAYDRQTNNIKIGDGTTSYSSLPFIEDNTKLPLTGGALSGSLSIGSSINIGGTDGLALSTSMKELWRTELGIVNYDEDSPLLTPAPAYSSNNDDTEENFNNWLDIVLENYTLGRQVRFIQYTCYPAITGGSALGILYRYTLDTAILFSFSTQNQLFIKQKIRSTWGNTVRVFPL